MDSAFLRQLCEICALKLTPEEETALLKDIQKIADQFEILCELPPFKALPDEGRIFFREDHPHATPTSDRMLLIDNFPDYREGFLQIPNLLYPDPPNND